MNNAIVIGIFGVFVAIVLITSFSAARHTQSSTGFLVSPAAPQTQHSSSIAIPSATMTPPFLSKPPASFTPTPHPRLWVSHEEGEDD